MLQCTILKSKSESTRIFNHCIELSRVGLDKLVVPTNQWVTEKSAATQLVLDTKTFGFFSNLDKCNARNSETKTIAPREIVPNTQNEDQVITHLLKGTMLRY